MSTLRRSSTIAAAAVAAGAIALTAPGMATGHQADKAKASQSSKIQYFAAQTVFDDFDTCAYTTVLSKTFVSPRKGVVAVDGQVGAARDTDNVNEGQLSTRVVIDGVVAGNYASANLENNGVQDAAVNPLGARRVSGGAHTVELQAQECGTGMAYIYNQSMIVSWSPLGSAQSVSPAKAKASLNR